MCKIWTFFLKLPFRPVIMELMNTQEYLIQSSYITTRTSLPLFTEEYHYSRHPKEAAHSHEFLEIGIILSGQVIHHTKEESSLLTPGCVYCIPIGQKHALESDREFTIRNLYLLPKILLTEASGENTPILLQDFSCTIPNTGKNRLPIIPFLRICSPP